MTPHDLLTSLRGPANLAGAPFGADMLALVAAMKARGGMGVYVARDAKQAEIARTLALFSDPQLEIIDLPGWDILPYDRVSPSASVASARCSAMAALAQRKLVGASGVVFVVTTASALVQRMPPAETMAQASVEITEGGTVNEADLTAFLSVNGYSRVSVVRERGEFAVRGGIIDLYPPTHAEPLRLDLFGDVLEQLRTFDPETQRSTGGLRRAVLSPVSEILFSDAVLAAFRERYLAEFGPPSGDMMFEAARASIRKQGLEHWLPLFHGTLETVFDYLPTDAIVGFAPLAQEAARERLTQANDYFGARVEAAGSAQAAKVLTPDALYLGVNDLEQALNAGATVRFSSNPPVAGELDLGARVGRDFAPERQNPDVNIFEIATAHARTMREAGKTVAFAAWTEGSAERLGHVLLDHHLKDADRAFSLEAARAAGLAICELPVEQGFETGDLVVIAEPDMLGDRLAAPRRKRKTASFIAEAGILDAGDLVVHVDHGIGKYLGLKTLDLTGAPHDCLELEYAGGDRIFLPVENIDLISRYGSEGADGSIDKLGGVGWQTRKAKAKKRILEMAEELLKIAAARQLKKAPALNAGQGVYEEFAARFPYDETDDQLNAIEGVFGDLGSGKPMDRLICGDVGFGKTEVALRAAFMAAMDGAQVAVIAPTTLLARQHYQTFRERFQGWPVKVGHLSRLVTGKDAAAVKDGIADGTIDIVCGTHALLGKGIAFKRLGLMVVDEEQRFGVKHKERLKELRADMHVLTLSATPIPRTLQMALTGIRDLSIIATPPVDRLVVRTYVTEVDTIAIREALLREKYRGGQAFYVAPRIQDLDRLEAFLREQVPEVSFIVAHGQMGATELEDIMTAFYEGKYDVLLSTTIVESGLDIPRANTLIIHRADRFGLAQLYQLRGRVGRSKLRAYAYFTTPKDQVITESAERRLKVLQSLDSLGAGFQLASHDLDMRGGGNLLGDQQSGHVKEVGVELYQSMLEDAVNALQAGGKDGEAAVADDWSPTINLGSAVLIPETYVEDLAVRLSLYRRLAAISSDTERESFAAELIDRFGPMPPETRELMEVTSVKARCKALGISKLEAGPKGALFTFREDTPLDPPSLMTIVRARPSQLKMRPDSKLVFSGAAGDANHRRSQIKTLLSELEATLVEAAA
ncbi:MAG: transcription-repair coupling factor [Pseudomonadota bacterium]